MERKLELKDIAGYLPYGLHCYSKKLQENIPIYGHKSNRLLCGCYDLQFYKHLNIDGFFIGDKINNFKPILRPLFDLYKTITHNGKEIVPIVKLAKIAFHNYEWSNWIVWDNKSIAITREDEVIIGVFDFEKEGCYFFSTLKDDVPLKNLPQLFDYLNELKIDYRGLIDSGLAVDVNTLNINPYK